MNLQDALPCPGTPIWESCPATPEVGQYDSPDEPEQVKIAMFEAMEGMAKDHAANIDQYGVLTALENLEGMDWLYGVSMTFQSLNAALCGLQQRATETCRDYYNCFTQITVLLQERHLNCFCPGELARMPKDCFMWD